MSDSQQSIKVLEELFQKLSVATADNRHEIASEVASFLNGNIIEHDVPEHFFGELAKGIKDKKTAANAMQAVAHIANQSNLSPSLNHTSSNWFQLSVPTQVTRTKKFNLLLPKL